MAEEFYFYWLFSLWQDFVQFSEMGGVPFQMGLPWLLLQFLSIQIQINIFLNKLIKCVNVQTGSGIQTYDLLMLPLLPYQDSCPQFRSVKLFALLGFEPRGDSV